VKRVFDTFPFSNELDLLEARLIELDKVVYRHVLVESPLTYTGYPKPLHFAENAERFAPWADRIVHVVADVSDKTSSPAREHAQRNALWQGIDKAGYEAGDILVTGDADEIPHPGEIGKAPGVKIMHQHHPVAVNLRDYTPWGGYVAHLGAKRPDMMELRQRLHSRVIRVREGKGWHFSWLGGPEAMRAKSRTLLELDYANVMDNGAEQFYRDRINPGSGNRALTLVEIDETFPEFMRERRGPEWWYWPGGMPGE
jgi:glycosyl transferase family 17